MPQRLTTRLFRKLFREAEVTAVLTGLALFSVACSSTADYYPPEYYYDQPARYYQVDPSPTAYYDQRAPVILNERQPIINERPVAVAPYYYDESLAPTVIEAQPPQSGGLLQGEILTEQELAEVERRERELAERNFSGFGRAPTNPPPPVGESAFSEQQADETARRLAEAQATFSRSGAAPRTLPPANVSRPDVYRPIYTEPEIESAPPVYRPPVVGSYSLVEQVQRALNDRGYAAGPVDGVMGSRTRSALGRFQADNGLPVTRNPDAATLQALGVYFADAPPAGYLPPATNYSRYK